MSDSTVAILGAGALGAAYASRFYQASPTGVSFIASGDRADRLRHNGVVVNGQHFTIPVTDPATPGTPPALILVALKHQHLAGALDDLARCVGPDTLIISVMNGLDSEQIIAEAVGVDRVLYAIAVGIDALREDNRVRYSTIGRITFGEAENHTPSERVRRVAAILGRAGIPHDTPPDMLRSLWWKFMINVGINQPSAVLRAPYHVFHTSSHAQAIMEAAMREVIALAQAMGIGLTSADLDAWYPVLHTLHPTGKTSMLQDVENCRPTEVDIFAGKVLQLSAQTGIPTPVNEFLFHAIKVIEATYPAAPAG